MSKLSRIKIIIMSVILIFLLFQTIISLNKEFAFVDSSNKEKIYNQIREYLQNNNRIEEDVESPQTFVEVEGLAIKGSSKEAYIYVWALIKECYIQDDKLIEAKEINMPYAFLYQNGEIISYKTPNSLDYNELYNMFPYSILNKIEEHQKETQKSNIDAEIEKYYQDYFDNQNTLVGSWHLNRAILNGEDTSLVELFGTGIQEYGGILTLYKQGTYTEYFGIYSNEYIADYQGTYEIKNESILLTSKSGSKKTLEYKKDTDEIVEKIDDGTFIYFSREDTNTK